MQQKRSDVREEVDGGNEVEKAVNSIVELCEEDKLERQSSYDPRLVALLEFFRHIYNRRRELLKTIVPKSTDEVFQILKKWEEMLCIERSNDKSLKRSSSVGSQRSRDSAVDEQQLKLDRFKIRTIVPGSATAGKGNSDFKSK